MGYWDATAEYLRRNSAPRCPNCGREMAAEDDHGRFRCLFCWSGKNVVTGLSTPAFAPIPQVDTTGTTDAQKSKIPPINRLHSTPTAAETRLLSLLAQGPAIMDSPEYAEARKALEKERGRKR